MTVLRHDNVQRTTHLLVQSMLLQVEVVVVGLDASAHIDGTMRVTGIVNSVTLKDGEALVTMNDGARLIVNADNLIAVTMPDNRAHSQRDTSKLAGWGDWLWGYG